ncbi:carboxylesterase type B [Streptomyces sp. 3211.6]|uniref:carboxylesterase/lipase family protein n=1 Tax=Streptomyces sp. 3211.6 TaxID=1938845 RepID=UPI000F1A5172|nr:carboxylesterase family protein [Streptomyces sp. 3211.6]RKT02665.1 carboxylesterase type B [Streptomyces sp. 3211.6]
MPDPHTDPADRNIPVDRADPGGPGGRDGSADRGSPAGRGDTGSPAGQAVRADPADPADSGTRRAWRRQARFGRVLLPRVRPARRLGGGLLAALLPVVAVFCAAGYGSPSAVRPEGGAGRPVVRTAEGPVRGRVHGAYASFEGIPYAAPPTGRLRWRAPLAAPHRAGVLDAGAPGARCPQLPAVGPGGVSGSEDCLYLNVTAPAGRGPARPVMVWFHGGGFRFGSADSYRPQPLAVRGDGAVVVTVNYRLGIFGFFGHPELGGAPDFGLADQQAALRWVRANAVAFGGDPGRVTVFGESAGGLGVCAHLVSPASAGLFQRAIVQSGSCSTTMPPYSVLPTAGTYEPFVPQRRVAEAGAGAAAELGCGGRPPGAVLDCLRGLDAARLVTASLMERFSAVAYGNALLPLEPRRALESGRFHRVPVVQGSTLDEMRLFMAQTLASYPVDGERGYGERLRTSFGASAPAVAAAYPQAAFPTAAIAFATLLSDASFTCPTLRDSRALARHVPVYGYLFGDRGAPNFTGLPELAGFPFGAAHGFELPYLFTMVPMTAPQAELAQRMTGYWTGFARTGAPGAPGAPAWPRFTGRAPSVLRLAPGPGGVRAVDAAAAHHCALWDGLPVPEAGTGG